MAEFWLHSSKAYYSQQIKRILGIKNATKQQCGTVTLLVRQACFYGNITKHRSLGFTNGYGVRKSAKYVRIYGETCIG